MVNKFPPKNFPDALSQTLPIIVDMVVEASLSPVKDPVELRRDSFLISDIPHTFYAKYLSIAAATCKLLAAIPEYSCQQLALNS